MKLFVIHAKKFQDRKKHIDRMLGALGLEAEYMSEGDVEELTSDVLNRYFNDNMIREGVRMNAPTRYSSCTLKHLLVCEKMMEEKLDGALVLEDDMVLDKKFREKFSRSIQEYERDYREKNVLISYEDTRLRFVPRSKHVKGKLLYAGDRDRMAGAYFINGNAARAIIDEVRKNKCHVPIDLFHRQLLEKGKLTYLWCQPTIASQGSHNGLFESSINLKQIHLKKYLWMFKLTYKKLLYELR